MVGVNGLNDLQSFGAAVCAVGSSNGTWPVKICYVVSFEDTSKPEGHFNKTHCHFRLTRRFSIALRQDRLPDLTSGSVGIVMRRVSTTTGNASEFSHFNHRRRRRKHRMPVISRASSFSSITDSTMSLNIITVELSMGQ